MAENLKDKREREGAVAMAQYEAEARAVREKTARLRELRLAHEAANKPLPSAAKKAPAKKKPAKKAGKGEPLSAWLDTQKKEGRDR
jgi:hypothetical protein